MDKVLIILLNLRRKIGKMKFARRLYDRYSAFFRNFFKPWGFWGSYVVFPVKAFLRIHRFFGMDKPFDKIEMVKDIHKGERCFIIATGPSLTFEDIGLLKNEITFSMNTMFYYFDKTDWRPTYYAIMDPPGYEKLHKKYKLDPNSFARRYTFMSSANRKLVKDDKKVIFMNICWLDHFYQPLSRKTKYNKNLLYGLYDFYSITQACMLISIYMGFKEIYLIGADNNYFSSQNHFIERNEFRMNDFYAKCTQDGNNYGYEEVGKIAKKAGVKIFNATRGGCVECYPRVSLDDIL